MLLENVQFGGYKLKSMIGKGGVAEVWLADQLALDREVAVKVISSELVNGDDSDFIDRFKREAHSVARLDHPGILPVFDYGESSGYLYLVMPYTSGGNLRSWVRRKPPTKEEIAAIFENITGGIGHAHSHGLIHRDLKPANILLNEEGRAFIADFGIAKTMDNNTNLTQAGIILGSPSYMAPEQFLGQADRRSDIYSMGLILFYLLTGRKLYNGRLPFEIGKRHLEDPIPLPDPQVPVEYETFLYKILAKNPDDRYQNAAEMLQAFRQIAKNRSAQISYNSGVVSSAIQPNLPPEKPLPVTNNDVSAQWMEEKRGPDRGPVPGPDRGPVPPTPKPAPSPEATISNEAFLFNSYSEIKASPPKPQPPQPTPPPLPTPPRPNANPVDDRWKQEKMGEYQPPPESTMWREFDPSLNSFGELKPKLDNIKNNPPENQWMQEKQGGGPVPGQGQGQGAGQNRPQQGYTPPPAQNSWMQEKQGGPVPGQGQQPNLGRPDAAYERYSQEKNLPPQGQANNAQPQNYRAGPVPSQQPAQGDWMAEKRGPVPGQNFGNNGAGQANQQAQWMREKSAVPGQPIGQTQGQQDQAAQWMREKEAIPGQGNFGQQGGQPGQSGVTKMPRKQPIWLFAIIGVLVVGIIVVVAFIFITGNKGPGTATPTSQAVAGTTVTPGTSSAVTTGSATTVAATTPAVSTVAATTAANGTTATNGTTAPVTSVAAGTGAVPLSGYAGPINMVSWSSNGQSFLTASDDKTVKIWDAASNKVTKTFNDAAKPLTDRVISAVFSGDGQLVAATQADNTVNVYSVSGGNVVAQVKGNLAVPAAIAGNGTLVAYAGSRTIHSFDLKKNAAGPEYPYFDPSVNGLAPTALAFTQDGATLAVGLSNGRIIIYETASGNPIMQLDPPDADKTGVRQLVWYGNTTKLAVGRDGSLDTLAVDLGKKIATETPANGSLTGPATSLSVSADGKRLAVSSKTGELQLWSLDSNAILTRSGIGNNPVIGLHWSQDDQKVTIATGGSSPALNTVAAQQTSRTSTVTLTAQNGTKVSGTATLTELAGGTVRVVLDVQGLDPGQHISHIHAGTCANQGDIKFDLEALRTTADGKASSTTVVKIDYTTLITGQFYVNVHNDPGTPTYIASCGEIHV